MSELPRPSGRPNRQIRLPKRYRDEVPALPIPAPPLVAPDEPAPAPDDPGDIAMDFDDRPSSEHAPPLLSNIVQTLMHSTFFVNTLTHFQHTTPNIQHTLMHFVTPQHSSMLMGTVRYRASSRGRGVGAWLQLLRCALS
ncbi:uncharacterized protein EDB91DRAFT_1242483 [Suillus paluster]|uniref:uncharacterized protein n=1 Tax=Suillus paluster TaxID=48578 RepID=UPI001B88206B|nr:uncharacterized protein EDB91DRAFT_1242483 [Suillus paluster]KAG1755282.1 hypothetical protein EDB91DRAFT_1242483 [Suillus paluster]